MTLYLEITKDKYELPLAVAESVTELSAMTGTKKETISSAISHSLKKNKWCRFIRIKVEENDND